MSIIGIRSLNCSGTSTSEELPSKEQPPDAGRKASQHEFIVPCDAFRAVDERSNAHPMSQPSASASVPVVSANKPGTIETPQPQAPWTFGAASNQVRCVLLRFLLLDRFCPSSETSTVSCAQSHSAFYYSPSTTLERNLTFHEAKPYFTLQPPDVLVALSQSTPTLGSRIASARTTNTASALLGHRMLAQLACMASPRLRLTHQSILHAQQPWHEPSCAYKHHFCTPQLSRTAGQVHDCLSLSPQPSQAALGPTRAQPPGPQAAHRPEKI